MTTSDDLLPFPSRRAQQMQKQKPKRRRGAGFIGVLGEILITLAVILALYAVWQLWWTTFQVTPGMDARVEQFQDQNPTPQGIAEPKTDPPPAPGDPFEGDIIGVLHVPLWDWMQIPISQGTTQEILDLGNAGHYSDTQSAGEIGNFALAGHRRTYGNNFRRVDILQPGDPLVVETKDAYLVYEMFDYEIIDPSQSSVLLPVPNQPDEAPTRAIMTMTTCHPEYGNSERYIVYSELKYWTAKADGKPDVLRDEPAR